MEEKITNCNQCGNQCPLTELKCGRGRNYLKELQENGQALDIELPEENDEQKHGEHGHRGDGFPEHGHRGHGHGGHGHGEHGHGGHDHGRHEDNGCDRHGHGEHRHGRQDHEESGQK